MSGHIPKLCVISYVIIYNICGSFEIPLAGSQCLKNVLMSTPPFKCVPWWYIAECPPSRMSCGSVGIQVAESQCLKHVLMSIPLLPTPDSVPWWPLLSARQVMYRISCVSVEIQAAFSRCLKHVLMGTECVPWCPLLSALLVRYRMSCGSFGIQRAHTEHPKYFIMPPC